MNEYQHKIELKVRDYECDLEGIVNNAVYLNYLEHARHEWLISEGMSFSELASRGFYLVVTRTEIDYRRSLRSGDAFVVCSNIKRISKLRFGFEQDIYRLEDNKQIVSAKVIGTSITKDGKPVLIPELYKWLEEH